MEVLYWLTLCTTLPGGVCLLHFLQGAFRDKAPRAASERPDSSGLTQRECWAAAAYLCVLDRDLLPAQKRLHCVHCELHSSHALHMQAMADDHETLTWCRRGEEVLSVQIPHLLLQHLLLSLCWLLLPAP